ncbi:Gamma-1-syntrophin [Ophiophagus hannah]|uniref:Gamma-1-syntrophin n=1 Tax=Ophiophagus hannah TaxID=8665 RepID=V8NV21_OPHHA|nr:Gamma-1-syntrophin [Ophiophagus hannah]
MIERVCEWLPAFLLVLLYLIFKWYVTVHYLQNFTLSKTGICLLQDGNQEPFKVRLHLAKDILTIQEQDVICVSGEPFYSGERTVTIRRQTVGGFGLSIKGGAEHNIPVVVSKISKEQRTELSGLLFIGDAILQINGINVRKCRHEEVVQVLRNAGEEVTLTVSFLKRAPAFLKLPLNEDCACVPSDQSSGTSSPLCDSGLHLNYHPNNTDTLSCSSWPTSSGIRWEKRWCDLRLIPLLHSRFSQYLPGSDMCRQNAFQVVAVDGICSGIIQCLSAEDCIDWLQAIAINISNLTKHNMGDQLSLQMKLLIFTVKINTFFVLVFPPSLSLSLLEYGLRPGQLPKQPIITEDMAALII